MFSTIGDLIYYLFHLRVNFPIQTFGFFVVLSFLLAYVVFTSEFKRYEALGKIHAFKRKAPGARPVQVLDIAVNLFLGFLFGWKVLGAALNYYLFATDPRGFILSGRGSIIAGCMVGVCFAIWVYVDRKSIKIRSKLNKQSIHIS